jgi:glycosyltransferase involved in cell wall biosynthesis
MISVCIISYNQKNFISECVTSCAEQNVDNLEVLVADDASTDGTQDVLRELERKYKGRFKAIFNERNVGITNNSNIVYRHAKGEYIAWMGGDDVMLPGKLFKQLEVMRSDSEISLCYHDLDVFESATNTTTHFFNHGPNSVHPYEGGAENFVQYGTFCGACSVLTRRSACPPDGFNSRVVVASDWLFWIEATLNGKIRFIPEVLGRYRRHSTNVTSIIRDPTDQMVTLGIVEAKYPHLSPFARKFRAQYYYSLGVSRILKGQGPEGRAFLRESLSQAWFSWKWAGWMARSFLG